MSSEIDNKVQPFQKQLVADAVWGLVLLRYAFGVEAFHEAIRQAAEHTLTYCDQCESEQHHRDGLCLSCGSMTDSTQLPDSREGGEVRW